MSTSRKVLGLLANGEPRGIHEISIELGLGKRAVEGACYRGWRSGIFSGSDWFFLWVLFFDYN